MINKSIEQEAFDVFRLEKQKELLAANRMLKYREASKQCRGIWDELRSYQKIKYINQAIAQNHKDMMGKSENTQIGNESKRTFLPDQKLEAGIVYSSKENDKNSSAYHSWTPLKYTDCNLPDLGKYSNSTKKTSYDGWDKANATNSKNVWGRITC